MTDIDKLAGQIADLHAGKARLRAASEQALENGQADVMVPILMDTIDGLVMLVARMSADLATTMREDA